MGGHQQVCLQLYNFACRSRRCNKGLASSSSQGSALGHCFQRRAMFSARHFLRPTIRLSAWFLKVDCFAADCMAFPRFPGFRKFALEMSTPNVNWGLAFYLATFCPVVALSSIGGEHGPTSPGDQSTPRAFRSLSRLSADDKGANALKPAPRRGIHSI